MSDTAYAPTGTIDDIVPQVRPYFEKLIEVAASMGMRPHVRSGGRTCEQQQEQVNLGYSHADLCRGTHVLGHALDIDLYPNACDTYQRLGVIWEQMGGVWGGRWGQFGACGDAGHFHYWDGTPQQAVPLSVCPSGLTLAQCHDLRETYLDAAFATSPWATAGKVLVVGALGALAFWATWRVT